MTDVWTTEFEGTSQEFAVREVREDELVEERQRFSGDKTGRKTRPFCSQLVSQGRYSDRCNRHATHVTRDKLGHESYVCKQHLSGKRRSVKNHLGKSADYDERQQRAQEAKERLAAVAGRLGIGAQQEYRPYVSAKSPGGYSATSAVVTIADLEALADRLEAE